MNAPMDFYDISSHFWDNVTYTNDRAGNQIIPEEFEVRFIFEGVLLTCVTIFGLVTNVIAIIVLLRCVNFLAVMYTPLRSNLSGRN